ncbi:YihY/virulence factor BrkB family protein [Salinigranum halophilum]|uniref:YihY/virulence factor BrkB family protein n=1 Tax=Salinigranum halophilum TaxID=2565931 RepID=UPI001F2C825C|nr:YihY/virulence factor BrkB family protein [Salinigranum halophilum]
MRQNSRSLAVARATVAVVREKHVAADAAGLAYYAFSSLVPLLVLAYAALTTFGTALVLAQALELVTGVGAGEIEAVISRLGGDGAGRVRAVALALVISVWSTHRMFRAVDRIFAEVYGVRQERSRTRRFLDSTLVLVTVTVGITVMTSLGVVLAVRVSGPLWAGLGPVVLWLSLAVVFVPMYVALSGPDVSTTEIAPGAAFAASIWAVSLVVFRLYLSTSETVELYGVAGAVLLVLSWLYVGSFALLVGVVLNAVIAGRVEPDEAWVPGEAGGTGGAGG